MVINKYLFEYRYGIILLLAYFSHIISKIESKWIDPELYSGLSIEFSGFLVIYYLIDSSIKRNKEEEDKKRKQICYRRLFRPLSRYMGFLKRLYKGTRKNPPDEIPKTLFDMFDHEFIENCDFLDWSADPNYFIQKTWQDYILTSNSNLIKDLNEILDTYSYALDNETISLIEDIIDSDFMSMCGTTNDDIGSLMQQMFARSKIGIGNVFRVGDGFLKLISLIIQLVNVFNPHIKNPIKVDKNSFNLDSLWGTARLQE